MNFKTYFKLYLESNDEISHAAKLAGYIIGPVFHGTDNEFNEFSHTHSRGQMGFHFGTESQSNWFSSNPKRFYLKIHNPLRLPDLGSWYGHHAKEQISSALNVKIISDNDRALRDAIIKAGYDGVIYTNKIEWSDDDGEAEDSYIAFYPYQIKLADPITYDDNANIISLDKRFNSKSNDIRF